MVSKKSIYYGRFDCFQAPMVPKAPRSIRRISHGKSSEGSKISPFDLLAAIADQLLQESESSTSSTSPEQKDQITLPKESPQSDNDSGLEHVSDVKTSGFLNNNVKLEPCEGKNVYKMEKDTPSHGDLCNFKSCSSVNLPFQNVKMGIRDDDENSFKFNHRGSKMRAFRSRSIAGYRRIRKMLISKYRKVTSKKDYELTNTTIGETKPLYQNRKRIYNQERCQIETPKRRKLLHEKSDNEDSTHVKFSIKSFKVPELYIEVPETATVGSLKRTVMEGVSAILAGELHVGILLEGKKVKDNNRTLQQTGISKNCDLRFTLEPSFLNQKEPPLLIPNDTNQELIATSAVTPIMDVGFLNSSLDCHSETSLDYHVDKNQEIMPESLTEEKMTVLPFLEPTKKVEVSQRRIRRPFSVSEVEALVEAVETLGTGRWRDIKLRAFDDANHRTYVDLKDKWKTLVHTAGIAPQQRRGEPVPQNLLDRVLSAHSYWSQHQRKHQTKPVQIMDGSGLEMGCIKI